MIPVPLGGGACRTGKLAPEIAASDPETETSRREMRRTAPLGDGGRGSESTVARARHKARRRHRVGSTLERAYGVSEACAKEHHRIARLQVAPGQRSLHRFESGTDRIVRLREADAACAAVRRKLREVGTLAPTARSIATIGAWHRTRTVVERRAGALVAGRFGHDGIRAAAGRRLGRARTAATARLAAYRRPGKRAL